MLQVSVDFAPGAEFLSGTQEHDYLLQEGVAITPMYRNEPVPLIFALPTPSQHTAPLGATIITQAMSDLVLASAQADTNRTALVLVAPDHIAVRDAWKLLGEVRKNIIGSTCLFSLGQGTLTGVAHLS